MQISNAAQPVTEMHILFGTHEVGQLLGTDLRDVAGLYFSVPRTPGAYSMFVTAKDVLGCTTSTTLQRTVTVQ